MCDCDATWRHYTLVWGLHLTIPLVNKKILGYIPSHPVIHAYYNEAGFFNEAQLIVLNPARWSIPVYTSTWPRHGFSSRFSTDITDDISGHCMTFNVVQNVL